MSGDIDQTLDGGSASAPLDKGMLGKYRVLCQLSTGGMSEIYLGQQTGFAGFNKVVVLKTILPAIAGHEDFIRMFLAEARTMASFNHPNIAQVYELDTDGGRLFMSMEFVEGCTLSELARALAKSQARIPIGFTVTAVRDTALALHYAHTFTDVRGVSRPVIHRDVAHKNIMVTFGGATKLLDFGIAKASGRKAHTVVGKVRGTLGYMSPEQLQGIPIDHRTDVFSLGVTLHECLTGQRLFVGNTAEEGARAVLHKEIPPPSKLNPMVSEAVDAVVLNALQRDRTRRYATALDMARALENTAGGLMWRADQMGELVSRCFESRRAETRKAIEAQLAPDSTSDIGLSAVVAKVSSGFDSKAAAPVPEPAQAPTQPVPPLVAPLANRIPPDTRPNARARAIGEAPPTAIEPRPESVVVVNEPPPVAKDAAAAPTDPLRKKQVRDTSHDPTERAIPSVPDSVLTEAEQASFDSPVIVSGDPTGPDQLVGDTTQDDEGDGLGDKTLDVPHEQFTALPERPRRRQTLSKTPVARKKMPLWPIAAGAAIVVVLYFVLRVFVL